MHIFAKNFLMQNHIYIMNKTIMNEILPISINNPIRSYYFEYSCFTYPWHYHSEYEILYIKESEGVRFVADSVEHFVPGDIIFLGTSVPHFLKSDDKYEENKDEKLVRGIIIQFERDFMEHSIKNYNHLSSIRSLIEESRRGIYFPYSTKLVELIEKIPLMQGVDQLTTLLILLDKMAKTNCRRFLGSNYYYDTNLFSTDIRIEKVISYINHNYRNTITLEKLSSLASMNDSSFCRYFKEKTGKTILEYIQNLRVGYACKLLTFDKMNINQISIESGFNTISNFNRTFKKIIKKTPKEYQDIIRSTYI